MKATNAFITKGLTHMAVDASTIVPIEFVFRHRCF